MSDTPKHGARGGPPPLDPSAAARAREWGDVTPLSTPRPSADELMEALSAPRPGSGEHEPISRKHHALESAGAATAAVFAGPRPAPVRVRTPPRLSPVELSRSLVVTNEALEAAVAEAIRKADAKIASEQSPDAAGASEATSSNGATEAAPPSSARAERAVAPPAKIPPSGRDAHGGPQGGPPPGAPQPVAEAVDAAPRSKPKPTVAARPGALVPETLPEDKTPTTEVRPYVPERGVGRGVKRLLAVASGFVLGGSAAAGVWMLSQQTFAQELLQAARAATAAAPPPAATAPAEAAPARPEPEPMPEPVFEPVFQPAAPGAAPAAGSAAPASEASARTSGTSGTTREGTSESRSRKHASERRAADAAGTAKPAAREPAAAATAPARKDPPPLDPNMEHSF